MKRTLLFIVCVLTSITMLASAVTVSDVKNSDCLNRTQESLPTIVLTKEGSVLSVQLLNYESYTATTDFNVTSSISDDDPCLVTIDVVPIIPEGVQLGIKEWVCQFNVSFTVHDLEPNRFYLDCWWFKGLVELTEGEPMVLEYKVENVTIDDMSFRLLKVMHKAMLMNWTTTEEELQIPSEVNYEGEAYTVTSISKDAFWNVNNAAKVTIPKTVTSMDLDYYGAIYANPFRECKSLEWIEVEDGCPLFSSVDGVLFAEDKTMLLGYPIASTRKTYTVPEGVTKIRSGAFVHNKYLRKLVIPEEVTYLGWHLFDDTKSLEELYIKGILDPECMSTLFDGMDTKVAVYVLPSEVEKFKTVYKGPIYPMPEKIFDDIDDVKMSNADDGDTFSEETVEGVLLKYTIISESEKTCMVGEEYHWPVPTARANRVLKVRGSQPSGDITIPEVANGYNVIRIEAFAFENSAITSVVIPNSVKTIGVAAFSGCVDLKSVTLPNQLSTIEGDTFSGCENLSNIDIPESVTSIGDYAFANCKQLNEVVIPSNVMHFGESVFWNTGFTSLPKLPEDLTTISNGMFYECTQLTSIEIPQSITRIGDTAFGRCPISEIEIPTSVVHIGVAAFANCKNLTNIVIPDNVTSIGMNGFWGCSGLKTITLSNNLSSLSKGVFSDCTSLESINIPSGVKTIGDYAFSNCTSLKDFNCYAENVPETESGIFYNTHIKDITLHVPAASVSAYQVTEPWKNFKAIVALPIQDEYRPLVEEGKVWKVGSCDSGNPVQLVEYYYFDGDTIIGGKTCKQMMCQRYISPDYPEYYLYSQLRSLSYVGAWYEENKKVYFCNAEDNQFKLMYDFSINANDTLQIGIYPYMIGARKTGGIKGFKGVYREVWECRDEERIYLCAPWLEGVGSIYGPPRIDVLNVELADPGLFLMECYVGDEVIYLNDGCEDGATPDVAGSRKQRIDFTHTTKIKPKTRSKQEESDACISSSERDVARPKVKTREKSEEQQSLYGEYNKQQLSINLDHVDDAYMVSITDESGHAVYEKTINASNIVGLNIDISAYSDGRYTVTVDNSNESFTGEFNVLTTGIEEVKSQKSEVRSYIYNLQGQRLSSLQKGLNIMNGRKVLVR